jgi:hypothetical protein
MIFPVAVLRKSLLPATAGSVTPQISIHLTKLAGEGFAGKRPNFAANRQDLLRIDFAVRRFCCHARG